MSRSKWCIYRGRDNAFLEDDNVACTRASQTILYMCCTLIMVMVMVRIVSITATELETLEMRWRPCIRNSDAVDWL